VGWELSELITILEGFSSPVTDIAFSPNDNLIAASSEDKTIRIWNRMGELKQTLLGHTDEVKTVVFTVDGAILLSAGQTTPFATGMC